MKTQGSSLYGALAPYAMAPCATAVLLAVSGSAYAQSLESQSVEQRLDMLSRVVEQQQKEIKSLENHIVELEMAQRGRGEPGYAASQYGANGAPNGAASGATSGAGVQNGTGVQNVDGTVASDGMGQQLAQSNAGPSVPYGSGGPAAAGAAGAVNGASQGTANGVAVTPASGAGTGTAQAGGTTPTIGTDNKAAEPERTQSEQAVVQKEHAPLFDHKLTIDQGLSYTYYDRRQLSLTGFLALDAIFLGNINLDQTKASQYQYDVDVRYGLTDRISIDADLPYMYRSSTFISGGAGGASSSLSDTSVNSSNIGDVNFGIYYQVLKETNDWPDVVASFRVKSDTGTSPFGIKLVTGDPNNNNLITPTRLPTGTGIWNFTAGVSVLKTYDPVVLFGSLSYTYNVAKSFSDISSVQGQVEPAKVKLGDIVQIGAGAAIALSDKTSASLSFTTAVEPETKIDSGTGYQKVAGSQTNASTMNFGLNQVINKHLTINGSVSIGLTPDAPNFVVGVRFPYTF
ncbi:Transporter [Pararobbsia alpina]